MFPLLSRIDRRRQIILASAAGALVILLLVLHPLARYVARSAAQARGWSLQAQSVRFGWRGLWMHGVRAQSDLPDLRAELQAVLVPWSGMFGSKRLAVYGGNLHLPQDLDRIQQRLRDGTSSRRQAKASRWQVRFSGVSLSWQSMAADTRLTAWGLAGDVTNDSCDLHADRVELDSVRVRAALTRLDAHLNRLQTNWALDAAQVARMSVVVSHVAEHSGVEHGAPALVGANALGARHPDHQAVTRQGHADAATKSSEHKAASKRAAESGGVAGEAPAADGLERVVQGFSRFQHDAERWRQRVSQHLASGAIAKVGELDLRWQYQEQKLDIGPLRAQVTHDAQATECMLEQTADANASRRYLSLRVPNQPAKIELEADIGSVSLHTLGVKEHDLGLRGVADTKLAAALKMSIDELESAAEWQARGEIVDLNLVQPWLAPRPVEGIQSAFSGKGALKWRPEFSLDVQSLVWSFGKARVEMTARLQRKSDETIASMNLDVPLAACEDLVEALPRGLAPMASQVQLDGTLSLQSGVRFDTAQPTAADVRWNLMNGCRVKSVSPAVSPDRFRAPFILEVPDEHRVFVQRAFGPGTPNWVAFADMSSHLANAVLVCEDGGFFRHGGFDAQAIRNSIRENLIQGRFARGASTVSMQLAKNLYLRREKTFSRKLQEAVLTILLEQSFSKNELMELYLNVVELGPGIYGVGEASRVYFNTTAAVLSPLQAYYLASLLPQPKVSHFGKDGHLSPGWLKLLRHLMTIANKRHYLSDEELKVALQDDLRLGVAESSAAVTDSSIPAFDDESTVDTHDPTEQQARE